MDHVERNRGAERFTRFCAGGVLTLVSLLALYLFVSALLGTADISAGGGMGEILTFTRDSLPLNLAVLGGSLALVFLFWRFCDPIPLRLLWALLFGWTLLFGVVFICSVKLSPSQDSYIVSFWAMQAAKGDYSWYEGYFAAYPYQFGFGGYAALLLQPLYRLMPGAPDGYACLLLQGVNLLWLCLAYLALLRLARLLSGSERAEKLTAVLLLLSPHGVLFATFVYGNLPGFACAALAVWLFLEWAKKGRWWCLPPCILFLAAAVILKLNYLIVFIALVIVWLLSLLRRRDWRAALCLVLCVAAVLGTKNLPQRLFEKRMGMEPSPGLPLWSWLALGLSEGQSCAGWYDATYTLDAFRDAEGDRAGVTAIAMEGIRQRLSDFRADPAGAADFFQRKFLSQWNEPSYEVIWNNNVREHITPPGRLYYLLCRDGEAALKGWMNFYQQLILLGLLLCLAELWRRREIGESLLPLILLGGMLYHLLFEAKSQYALVYFWLMIPLAAWGAAALFARLFPPRRYAAEEPLTEEDPVPAPALPDEEA